MAKIRLVFIIKQLWISTQRTPQIGTFCKRDRQKIYWLWQIRVIQNVCSLPWSCSWGRHAKRDNLTQLQTRLRFCSEFKFKDKIISHIFVANFAVKTDHLIQTVWNFATSQSVTKKYTVNFFYPHGDENINSPRLTWQFFLIKMLTWFLAYQTTILHWWFSYSNHLSATKTYWNRTEKQRDDSPSPLL